MVSPGNNELRSICKHCSSKHWCHPSWCWCPRSGITLVLNPQCLRRTRGPSQPHVSLIIRVETPIHGKTIFILRPGGWFNIKMSSYQYRKSHCGDKTGPCLPSQRISTTYAITMLTNDIKSKYDFIFSQKKNWALQRLTMTLAKACT